MAVSSHLAGSETRRGVTPATTWSTHVSNLGAVLAGFGRKAQVKTISVIRALQSARMLSTLTNMSDYQLAEIGISRSDIPRYAEKLMENE
ncbi:MAG: DUF1127 domain-containing protein [Sulfitobacter sp.]